MLWPLLVTAINLPDAEICTFKGRSPNGRARPAGLSFQPLGNKTSPVVGIFPGVWAMACAVMHKAARQMVNFNFII